MTSFSDIRRTAELIPDDEVRSVCLKIIEEVRKRSGRDNLGLWTVETMSKWVGLESTSATLNRGIQLLASRRDAQLLEIHFIYFDPRDPSATGDKIEDEEVADAYRTGFLVHPRTGAGIADFEDFLLPYFVPAPGVTSA